jgi:hypothetical protein
VALREWAFASAHHVALLVVVAALRIAWWRRSDALAPSDDRVLPLLLWSAAMLAAAAVGLRFYKGYFVSVAPPLALLASSAWAGRARPLRPPGVGGAPAVVSFALTTALLGGLVVRQVALLGQARVERSLVPDAGAHRLGRWVAERSDPEDRIWVWGWHLWPVYSYADRRPASAMYKSLGLLTMANDDTWRTPASPLRFVEGEWSDRLVAGLRAHPPRFVLLGGTVPHEEFTGLRTLLRQEYRRATEIRVGRVEVWERRSPVVRTPLAEDTASAP